MTKPLRYDSSINFRLEHALHNAFIEACGGQEKVHARLRSLISQYVGKRQRERGKRPSVPSIIPSPEEWLALADDMRAQAAPPIPDAAQS